MIDKRFNAGRTHGYLLTKLPADGEEEDGLRVFDSSGPLILMDYRVPDEHEAHLSDSPHYKKWYAHDDRYVYAFDGSQLWRYPTPNTKAVRVKWKTKDSGYGYWANYRSGELDGRLLEDGAFIPTGIPYNSSVNIAQYSDGEGSFSSAKPMLAGVSFALQTSNGVNGRNSPILTRKHFIPSPIVSRSTKIICTLRNCLLLVKTPRK